MVLPRLAPDIVMTLRTLLCTLALIAAPAAFAALKAGDPAPAFSAPASLAGKPFTYSLKDGLAKGPVVVYFYPSAYTYGLQHPGARVLDPRRPVRRRRRDGDRRLARQHRAAQRVLRRPRLLRRQARRRLRPRRQDRARLRPARERRARAARPTRAARRSTTASPSARPSSSSATAPCSRRWAASRRKRTSRARSSWCASSRRRS